MRVLVIAQTWEPEEGIPQRRWAWLTRQLTQSGHEVHAVVPPPHYPTGHLLFSEDEYQIGAVAEGKNGEVIHRTAYLGHDSTLYSRMRNQGRIMTSQIEIGHKVAAEWRPDIIVATAPPLPTANAADVIASRARVPFVLDLRDAWPDLLKHMNDWAPTTARPARQGTASNFKNMVFRGVATVGGHALTHAIGKAAGIVTTTESFTEVLRNRGVEQTMTLRNLGTRRNFTLEAPNHTSGLNVLYAGTTGRVQELSNAIHAVAEARERNLDVRMRIVGSGAHLKTLRRNAQALELPIEFTGRLPFDQILPHYEWADTVLIHLQDWKPMEYTVPSKLYEALEIGRHISLSVAGEAAQIVTSARAGDAVPPMNPTALADLWERLIAERSLLNTVGRGLEWLEKQGTPEDNAARFVDFLEKIRENAC
ncbi:glycosyltransferase family 4 protein [Schaalia vaccimaxillae]|uniref:glycosyltransferase family 4 protein n=1 Tax=Schaalia vaccimaxillae TaxID=183916 RepID=UPI0003B6E660|nr:glycosyltransferase family 4 protein [Schaalia vaccimaxillae]